MSFASLIGNERNKQILQRFLRNDKLGITLIFAGPDGVGKQQFALTLAKAANCQNNASQNNNNDSCDQCPNCRRIEAGEFGDVVTLKPDGAYIKIAQTRALISDVQVRPREGKQRFFIIEEADRLREEAANSLLKTLEEPPSSSTIILLTSRPNTLLPTVRSRAQKINFAPLKLAEMQAYLEKNFERSSIDNQLLAHLSEGRIGQVSTIDLAEYRRERRELIELLELLMSGNNRVRLIKAAEHYGKQERETYEKMLDLMLLLLRDIFRLAALGTPDGIINIDAEERLLTLAEKVGLPRVTSWVRQIDELRANLRININRQIATEAAFLSMSA